jgi:arsenical pump membrane protein
VDRAIDNVTAMVPALLFLCAGVPLASLLDRLGFFEALAILIDRHFERVPVAVLWWLAAATTVVLNLDTTVVLLTPLYVRLARRAGVDPLPLALIPLLLASFASSVLPVSNLTTLIAVDRFDLSVSEVFVHLAPVSAVACIAGWLAYRRRHPTTLPGGRSEPVDRRAVIIGGSVVTGALIGFVAGPSAGVAPWMVAVAADLVLIAATGWLPWKDVPVATAAGVSAVAVAVALVVPADVLTTTLARNSPAALGGVTLLSTAAAGLVNNLPALLVALEGARSMSWGMWAWLAGVNTGAVVVPLGALANLLWWRLVRDEGIDLTVRGYLRMVTPIAVPAVLCAAAAMTATRLIAG